MSMREFVKQNREAISDSVARAFGENCRPTNDSERADWVNNDEGLYSWARSEGVRI